MRPISLIVIHCSATPNGSRRTVEDIDAWHAAREFHRQPEWRQVQNPDLAAIGYHYVIYPRGTVVTGRHVDEPGAHARGFNKRSIGICLIGTDAFTAEQWDSLGHLVTAEVARCSCIPGPGDRRGGLSRATALVVAEKNDIRIAGHRDLPEVHKECPGFSVSDWLAGGMAPLAGHIHLGA